VASGPTTNRPDEAPDDALDPPNLPDFRKLAHGDFSAVDWRIFWSLLPLVVFLVLNSFWPEDLWRTQVAIVASFAASTWVFATNRDSGVIRFITVLGFIVVAGSAVVGLAADSAKADAMRTKSEYEAQLAEAKTAAAAIIDEARGQADQLRQDLQARAEADIAEQRARAAADIESSRRQAIDDLRTEVAAIAVGAAERVVGASLDADVHRSLIDGYIDEVAGSGSNGNGA